MTRAAVDSGRNWPNVFTPASLADWWGCSERQVRKMIDAGDLPAFRLGGKLLRIRPEDVEAFECQNQSGASPSLTENAASHGMTRQFRQDADVIALERPTGKRLPASPRLDTRSLHGRKDRQ